MRGRPSGLRGRSWEGNTAWWRLPQPAENRLKKMIIDFDCSSLAKKKSKCKKAKPYLPGVSLVAYSCRDGGGAEALVTKRSKCHMFTTDRSAQNRALEIRGGGGEARGIQLLTIEKSSSVCPNLIAFRKTEATNAGSFPNSAALSEIFTKQKQRYNEEWHAL